MRESFSKKLELYLMKNKNSFFRKYFVPHSSNNFTPKLTSKKSLLAIGIALVLVSIFAESFLGITAQSRLQNFDVEQIVNLTNVERQKNELAPLNENKLLKEAAFLKAEDMLAKDYWQHNSTSGEEPWDFIDKTGYKWLYAGENLAKGFQDSEELISAWMKSKTHRENILNPNYSEVGVALMSGKLEGKNLLLVVQMFAAPDVFYEEVSSEITVQNIEPLQAVKIEASDLTPPVVRVDVAGGTYNKDLHINLSVNEDAKIYYTLNGKDPDYNSRVYTGTLSLSSSRILKFMAIDKSGNKSEIQTEKYLIKKLDTRNPEILSPADNSYWNTSQITIKGNAYTNEPVLIKQGQKILAEVPANTEKYFPFAFETELKDGSYEIYLELKNTQRVSEPRKFTIDSKAPVIEIKSLNLKATRQTENVAYDLSVKVAGDPEKVLLILPAERVLLTETSQAIYSGNFSLPAEHSQVKATLYAEDLARNISSESISISGNVGETLGVVNSNEQITKNKIIFSDALQTSLKNVSLAILIMITVSLLLSTFVYYRRGLKYKGKHAMIHSSISVLLIIALIFL